MSFQRTQFAAATTIVALMGSTALADVTAQQVWDTVHKSMAMHGEDSLKIESEVLQDGVLTVSGITVSSSFDDPGSDDSGSFTYMIDEMVFAEQGDGTVKVTSSEDTHLSFKGEDMGEPFEAKMILRQNGAEVVVGGTPESMTQTVNVDSLKIIMEDFGPNVTFNGENAIEVKSFESTTLIEGVATKTYDQKAKMAEVAMVFDMDIVDADEPGKLKASGTISDLVFNGQVTLPDMVISDDMQFDEFMKAGFAFAGAFSSGKGEIAAEIDVSGEPPMKIVGGSGGGSFSAAASEKELNYQAMSNDVYGEVTSDGLPFPIKYSASEYGASLRLPLGESAEPSDFGLSLTMADLAVNDEVWMLFDPEAVLPRGPATLRAGISGKAKILMSLFDEDALEEAATSDTPPAEIHSAQIDALEIDAVGARLTGTGAVEFDNSDLETFDGVPVPEGKLNFEISGANGLIDNLVKLGVIPEDEAMMSRMMLGMFARATGDDSMESEIEFRNGGEIYANGQRLR